jgi:hypothetical protein
LLCLWPAQPPAKHNKYLPVSYNTTLNLPQEFWSIRAPGLENATRDFADFGTVSAIHMSGGAYEINSIPAFNSTLASGASVLRLPQMAMPIVDGRSVLFMGSRTFQHEDIVTPLEKALASGKLDVGSLLAGGQRHPCVAGNTSATTGMMNTFGRFFTSIEDDECVWALRHYNESCCGNMSSCFLPQYLDGDSRLPIKPEASPASLRAALWPRKPKSGPYDALSNASAPPGGCRDSPGPAASTLYCVQTTSPTWVAYRWYRFVDQPGIQQALHSQAARDFVQGRVESLHKMLVRQEESVGAVGGSWIKRRGATAQGIARIDDAAVVTPPQGMEIGYVPIALFEGLEKPAGCQVVRPPAPVPPTPAPAHSPGCPKLPVPGTCDGKCMQAGHCCRGSNSNDGLPSCEMGCIIANYTATVAQCQRVCRDHAHNCSWTIGAPPIHMTSCARNCPPGCDSADGPFECEAGCTFAFAVQQLNDIV